jgi:RecA/RadA recombinase
MSKKFDLVKYKASLKLNETQLKPEKFVELDPCLQVVLGMPGLPLGHINQIYGKSDTGKTSLLFHAAAKCLEQDILPVLLITEGKIDWGRAAQMGVDRERCIVVDSAETGGQLFLEDVYKYIDQFTSDVIMGNLPQDVMIFWDSVGNTLSKDEVEVKKDGTFEIKATMMKAAKINSNYLRSVSAKVNSTRQISSKYYVGLTLINTCYTKPPVPPATISSEVPYGGDQIWFKSTLVIRTKRRKKLDAIKQGAKLGFGVVSAITVEKNHLTNTSHSGEFVITADAIIPNEKGAIDDYKESHRDSWGEEFTLIGEAGEVFDGEA